MISLAWAFDWLVGAAVMSLAISAAGSAAALVCREPVRRMRVVTLTLAGCLLVPLVALMPGLPRWSVPEWAPLVEEASAKPQAPAIVIREVKSEQAGEAALAGRAIENAITVTDSASEIRRDEDPAPTVAMIDGDAADDFQIKSPEPGRSPAPTSAITPPVPSAAAPGPHVTLNNLRALVVGLYPAGLAGLAAWWLLGCVALRRVLRAARPAPDWCRKVLGEIAGPVGDRVALLVSARVRQPFTFGWRRAFIVIPAEMCRASASDDLQAIPFSGEAQPDTALATPELRWSLAHEWAHIIGRDVCVWSLAGLVRTIYFYQPLCWWLRAQLRLCQDYLADAAAAREASPEAYAEFLATRAAGRPLAYGLGIAGGKSDLYRRVAMLVKNHRPLETRCPWWWSAAAASAAIVLVFLAATFGDKRPLAADDDRPLATAAADDEKKEDEKTLGEKKPGAAKPAPSKPDTKPGKPTPAKVEKEPADDARQKLLEGLFARATAIKSGRFEIREYQIDSGKKSYQKAHVQFVISGDSWLKRALPTGEGVSVNHAGRLLVLRKAQRPASSAAGTSQTGYEFDLRIAEPLPMLMVQGIVFDPVHAGTIWLPRTLPYLQEHAAAAQLRGPSKVDDVQTQVVEWEVPADDAPTAFPRYNDLLAGGGIYRVHVAPQLGYAVPKIEFIDRFGTPQFVFAFSDFHEDAPGIYFPRKIVEQYVTATQIDVVAVADVNALIDERQFVVPVPAATRVVDTRPHREDKAKVRWEPGATSSKAMRPRRPLGSFTTGVEYPDGLPAALLAEMDRDVIPPDEPEKGEAETPQPKQEVADQNIPDTLPPADSESARKGAVRRQFIYGGKSFATWRDVLLGDLEPDTRVKALTALGAFASNGYAQEVAAAIGELLKSDGANAAVGPAVQQAACEALARCGSAGVPVLTGQLESETILSRRIAVHSLAAIVPSTESVATALLKAAKDRDSHTRGWAWHFLARNHPDRPAVVDALAQAVHDEKTVRLDLVTGLSESRAAAESVVALVRKFLEDDDTKVHGIAAAIFAARAPATDENARALEMAVFDSGSLGRFQFVESLKEQQGYVEVRPELVVPILIELIESRETYGNLTGNDGVRCARMIVDIFSKMTGEKAARAAIPVLIKIVGDDLPIGGRPRPARVARRRKENTEQVPLQAPSVVLAAAETLGQFGPAAEDALPALKWLLEPGLVTHSDLQSLGMETQRQWQARIQAIIDKIEGK